MYNPSECLGIPQNGVCKGGLERRRQSGGIQADGGGAGGQKRLETLRLAAHVAQEDGVGVDAGKG
eukprot:scaffold27923_cov129-Isochrysis_galbana.AAC.1